jgi:NTE family protein
MWPSAPAGPLAEWQNRASALTTVLFGQPGFFRPRPPQDWFSPNSCVSYYITSALKETLVRHADFDRINSAKDIRLSVGAVNVRTARFAYFDSERITIRPEHVMASGALPPAFPPIEIDGEQYWDGGLYSNTPLQYMVDYYPRRSRLIFQVDLFPAYGSVPDNLDEANEREKDVRYSSRTRLTTDMLREKHDVRHAINELHKLLPPEIANTEQAKRLYEYGCVTEMDIAQLIYRPMEPQGALKDFQFGRATMEARWQQGFSDAQTTLKVSPWLAPMPKELGVRVFDVMHEILVRNRKQAT